MSCCVALCRVVSCFVAQVCCSLQYCTIKVGIKQEAYELAERFTEGPVVLICVVINEEGKRKDVECVTHCQVEHVDGGRLPALCAAHNHIQRRGIQRQAEHKDQGVADGKEDEFKIFIKCTEGAEVGVVAEVRGSHRGCENTWGIQRKSDEYVAF